MNLKRRLILLLLYRHLLHLRGEEEGGGEGEGGGGGGGGGGEEAGEEEGEEGEQALSEILLLHMHVYCTAILSRHLLDFTFRETTYNWSTDLEDVDISPFIQRVRPFSASVLEIFQLFFTTTLMATIVGETNHYARKVLGESAGAKWEDVVEEDLWAFLGFALPMGINRLPQLRLYWSTDPVYHYLPIAERITRDRFLAIWRFLHFSRNTPSPVASASSATATSCSASSSPSDPIDPLWKVRPVISTVVAAGRANYRPHEGAVY